MYIIIRHTLVEHECIHHTWIPTHELSKSVATMVYKVYLIHLLANQCGITTVTKVIYAKYSFWSKLLGPTDYTMSEHCC